MLVNILLLAAVSAALVFGWFLTGRLDRFLDENYQALELQSAKDALRIGFSDPCIADSITNVLEQYSKIYPGISIRTFFGSEEKLKKGLSDNKFNVIFLPENADIPNDLHYNIKEVVLVCTPVMTKYGGLPIEPITDEHIIQNVLWTDKAGVPFVRCFMDCLEHAFAVPKRQI